MLEIINKIANELNCSVMLPQGNLRVSPSKRIRIANMKCVK